MGGTDVSRAPPRDRARRGLARTFQHSELFFNMTPREHLVLAYTASRNPKVVWRDWLSIKSTADEHEGERVNWILRLLDLESVADRNITELPLGVGRLVELGRAIATCPQVLLLDEPCAGLNPKETDEVTRVLQRLVAEEGTGILLVEHDLEMVMRVSDEVVVLDRGQVIARGSPGEVRHDPAVRRAYLGANESRSARSG